MTPAARLASLFAGCGAAALLLVPHEGWVNRGYPDPVHGERVLTACAGVTGAAVQKRPYTDEECVRLTAAAMVSHAAEIAPCLPENLPPDTHGAFISFAYNVGTGSFCNSTLSRKARAGDLPGACAELSRWVYAGGRDCRDPRSNCIGIVKRRQAERALCEAGLQ